MQYSAYLVMNYLKSESVFRTTYNRKT